MKRKDDIVACYPISLNIKQRKCVVVGGGAVALRKVKVLLEHGADVEVISPYLCTELSQLAKSHKVKFHNHEYEMGNLESVYLAIAATDDAVINRQVAAEAMGEYIDLFTEPIWESKEEDEEEEEEED